MFDPKLFDGGRMHLLLKDADERGHWLLSAYAGVIFSPDELRREQVDGRYRWGVTNWRQINPRVHLGNLKATAAVAAERANQFEARLMAPKSGIVVPRNVWMTIKVLKPVAPEVIAKVAGHAAEDAPYGGIFRYYNEQGGQDPADWADATAALQVEVTHE